MTVQQIKRGRVYKGTDGRTRKVQSIDRDGRGRVVVVRDITPTAKRFAIESFAASMVEDVTPAPRITASARIRPRALAG